MCFDVALLDVVNIISLFAFNIYIYMSTSKIVHQINFFFDRKRQRNILIKRKYKRRIRNPPTKEKQNYK